MELKRKIAWLIIINAGLWAGIALAMHMAGN